MDYKKELLEMIQKMENIRFLAMAYGFIGRLYKIEKEQEKLYGLQKETHRNVRESGSRPNIYNLQICL